MAEEISDYDMQGYTAKYGQPDQSKGQHLTDEFKRPNHITFSSESKYSKPGQEGGRWEKDSSGKWNFYPSEYNLKQHSAEELKNYFNEHEKDSILHLPEENKKMPDDKKDDKKDAASIDTMIGKLQELYKNINEIIEHLKSSKQPTPEALKLTGVQDTGLAMDAAKDVTGHNEEVAKIAEEVK